MFIPPIELCPLDEIARYQSERLSETLQYLSACSPFYQKFFKVHRIKPEAIKTVADLRLIPPVTKDDFAAYNDTFRCVPLKKIIDLTITSGTTGQPVTVGLTEADLQRLAYNEYISFCCASASEDDIFQLMVTLDRQFMAGMAYHLGVRKLGATMIRTGPGLPWMQLETIQRLKPTVLIAVPSFLLKLIEFARSNGFDLSNTSVKKVICIGENIRQPDFSLNHLASRITEHWNIQLFSTYASTEMQTAFSECEAGKGGHHHPELIIVELLDDQDNPVKPGEVGEVTITTLGIEATPLLRYKTGDITVYYDEPCSCGRHTLRLGPIIGRKNHMLKYKGTTLYPAAIMDLLNGMPEISDYAIEAYTSETGTDEITLHLHATTENPQLINRISNIMQSKLRVLPEIHFVAQDQLLALMKPEQNRKIQRFIDNRKKVVQTTERINS
ncbi:MAG: phenylacetate--CoA ligase [Chitinophagales bacterium]|nr:MAG: phenylacetate--CoA ligase [Chitinophagales bacterium]